MGFFNLFGQDNNTKLLAEKIKIIREKWDIIKRMIAVSGQADPSYLWTDDVREIIISIHNECGRVIKIKSDNEWIEKAQEGIDKMQRDLEVIIGDTAAKPAPKNAMGRRRFLRM